MLFPISLTLMACLAVVCPPSLASIKGEIINISRQYQVAFTDIGNDTFSAGDIVQVDTNDNQPVYLQVMEANTGLSKLAFVKTGKYKTDSSVFEKIIVGNTVTIISQNVPVADKGESLPSPTQKTEDDQKYTQIVVNLEEKEKEVNDLKQSLQDLQNLNRSLKQENSQLYLEKHINEQEKSQNLEEISNLKDVLGQLKARLENVGKLLQGENSAR